MKSIHPLIHDMNDCARLVIVEGVNPMRGLVRDEALCFRRRRSTRMTGYHRIVPLKRARRATYESIHLKIAQREMWLFG